MFCPRKHRDNVPKLTGEKHDFFSENLHQAGFEHARKAAVSRDSSKSYSDKP